MLDQPLRSLRFLLAALAGANGKPIILRAMTGKNPPQVRPVGRPENFGALSELLTIRLRGIDFLLTQCLRNVVPELRLRTGTIAALALVVENPGISQTEITNMITQDKSAMVAIMNRLEELGWVVRRKAEADRRRHEIFASEDGKAALKRVISSIESVQSTLLAEVPDEEIARFNAMLDRFYKACVTAAVAS